MTIFPLLFQAVLLMVRILLYLLCLTALEGYQERLKSALMQKQLTLPRDFLEQLAFSAQALQELRHEMKNYLFYMTWTYASF